MSSRLFTVHQDTKMPVQSIVLEDASTWGKTGLEFPDLWAMYQDLAAPCQLSQPHPPCAVLVLTCFWEWAGLPDSESPIISKETASVFSSELSFPGFALDVPLCKPLPSGTPRPPLPGRGGLRAPRTQHFSRSTMSLVGIPKSTF